MSARLVFAVLCAALSLTAAAQGQFPSRPLRLVVPFAPGGGADLLARVIAEPLGQRLGQPVVVDNKPGGGGVLGANVVAKSLADGHTLLYTTPGPQMTAPFLLAKLPYNPVEDLVPVSRVAVVPAVLVVPKDMPVRDIRELVAYAKARPGQVNFASAGPGTSSHLAGELFKQMAAVSITHIPYRGTAPAMAELLAGQVQLAIDSIAAYKPAIDAGLVRALGVSSLQRSPLLSQVPSIAEELRGFESSPVNYISVPAGTPPTVVERLNREINAVLQSPRVREHLLGIGVVPLGSSAADMATQIRTEAAKWKAVIAVSGAKIE